MTDFKRPFYEVISDDLRMLSAELTSNVMSPKAAQIMILLKVLERSKIPTEEAHDLANVHSRLPNFLEKVGQTLFAEQAKKILGSLVARR